MEGGGGCANGGTGGRITDFIGALPGRGASAMLCDLCGTGMEDLAFKTGNLVGRGMPDSLLTAVVGWSASSIAVVWVLPGVE